MTLNGSLTKPLLIGFATMLIGALVYLADGQNDLKVAVARLDERFTAVIDAQGDTKAEIAAIRMRVVRMERSGR